MKKIVLLILLNSFLLSDIFNVPSDTYPTIQSGIDVAQDGDTVLVSQGTYYENLIINRSITLASHAINDDLSQWNEFSDIFLEWVVTNDNINNTIIDGGTATDDFGSAILIYAESDECITPEIIGFTIQNGLGTNVKRLSTNPNEFTYQKIGGGILSDVSNPKIHHNKFINNGSSQNCSGRDICIDEGGAAYLTSTDEDWDYDNVPTNYFDFEDNYREICDNDEFDLSNNFYDGNDALYGNSFANKGFEDTFNMSESIFDVANCSIEEVSPVWVYVEPVAEVTLDDIASNICAFSGPNAYVDSNIDQECIEDGCGTLNNPFKTITWALQMIMPSENNLVTLHIANGMYSSEIGEEFPIIIPSYVSLQGESEELTILDANQGSNVIIIQNTINNSISNITITDGSTFEGGGIYLNGCNNPIITNVTIANCNATRGGGVYLQNCSADFSDVSILSNIASSRGGGIYIYNAYWDYLDIMNGDPTFTNVTLAFNEASIDLGGKGGGVYFHNDDPDDMFADPFGNMNPEWSSNNISIENMTIFSNTAMKGGGCFITGLASSEFRNLNITYNNAYSGGGIYFSNMTEYIVGIGFVPHITKLENSIISNNTASGVGEGGGVYYDQSNPDFHEVIIASNSARLGGGVYLDYSYPNFTNTTIKHNVAEPSNDGYGGGIYMNESSLNLMDVLIHSNIAYSGGAVYGLTTYSPKHLTLLNVTLTSNVGNNSYGALSLNNSISLLTTNSIIWNNGINPILIDYYFDLTHSNVDSELFADNCSDCFSLDPVFVDPENEDFTLGITSPCIDNGTTDWSVIGQNSFNFEWVNDMLDFYGTAPDIGAFESNYILGDLNQDHYLNILDVVILINLILGINTPTDYQLWASDLNQDQIINVLDVITLINIIFDI